MKENLFGLIIIIIGAALSFFTVKNLPADIIVHGGKPTFRERFIRNMPLIALITGVLACLILTLTIIF